MLSWAGGKGPAVLIDERLPVFDADERHAVTVAAPPARAYEAIRTADFRRCLVIRPLFLLRSLPGLLADPRATMGRFLGIGREPGPLTLGTLTRAGFFQLGERPGSEIRLGTVGRFWKPSGGMRPTDPTEFDAFSEPGFAKAVWSFAVSPGPDGTSVLTTETRVLCTDAASRRRFRLYWRVIRPWSGLIRRDMLRVIRAEAEGRG